MVPIPSNFAATITRRALTLAAFFVALMAGFAQAAAAAPTVTSISPHAGPTGGGTSVTIGGTGFVLGASSVAFGGTAAASVVVNSTTSITATAPSAAAGTDDITVTTAGGTSATSAADKFTFDPTPTVTAVSPAGGPTSGGTSVTVSGTGFVSGATTVDFGLLAATSVTVTSATSLTAVAPADTGTVDVTASTAGGASATSSADRYAYDPVPTVSGVSPAAGPTAGGSSVTITGTGFVAASTTVAFGAGHPGTSVVVNSATSITVTSPAEAAGTVDLTVTTPGGTSAANASDKVTFDSVPAVTTINVSGGPVAGGTSVTITGTGFVSGGSTVAFGGTAAASVVVNSTTSITATTPAESAATVDITVTTPGGTSATVAGDKFAFDPVPVVSAVSPGGGPLAGATSVTVTGTGFVPGSTTVAFGTGHAGTGVTVNSSTSLTVTAPAESAGTVDITVTTAGGSSATSSADKYGYDPVPTVSAVGPAAGPAAGGTSVTVTGTGFVSGSTTVAFGAGHAGTGVVVNSPTSITVTSPAESAGTIDVLVTTPGGTSAAGASDKFIFDPIPVVSTMSAAGGPLTGGTVVTISGSGFITGNTSVSFGSTPATSITVTSGTSMTATAPAESAGTVDVTVTTPGGTSAMTAADRFAFDPVPAVTAVSPDGGPLAGGTPVTITGTGFVSGATVAFGTGHAGTGVTVDSSTSLTVTAPAESTGTVDVTVSTPGGTSPTGLADRFEYDPLPTVSGVSPAAGPAAGGTSVTITGSGFVAGSTAVAFGSGHAASGVVVNSPTSITATSPAESAGTVDVLVTTPGGTSSAGSSDKFVFDPVPVVSAMSAGGGPLTGGTVVTITGSGFITGGTTVSFGASPASTVTVNSATSITATSPAEPAGTVEVTVTTVGGTSTAGVASTFSFDPVPSVTGVAPAAGPLAGGIQVVITGTGFVPGVTTVLFGTGHPATGVAVTSATSLTLTPPAGSAGTVDVTVTTPGGTSGASFADKFTYDPAPTVTSISASAGPALGGTSVTITGTNFIAGATTVSFGAGAPAASVVVTSPTSVTAVSPRTAPGTVDVTATTPGGTSATSTADRFTLAPTPAVTAITATGGPLNGGTTVTITGVGFIAGATSVSFGSTPAAKVTINNPTSITVVSPAETAGTVDITATTVNGTSPGGSADRFSYDPVPTVTAVSPAAGPTGGGSKVTVTGTGFVSGATSVSFGSGHAAASITVNSATSLTTSPPPGASGTVDLSVSTPGGTSFISPADEFSYSAPPSFASIAPRSGTVAGGTSVTIAGGNFIVGETTVLFGTVPATNVAVSATSITATSPAASDTGTLDVTVSTPAGVTAINPADTFTYTPIPIVNGVSPYAGAPAGGTAVRIYGAHLSGATAVFFGSKAAASFKAISDTEVTAVSPKRKAGSVGVTVITPLGPTPAAHAATFIYASAPVATGESASAVTSTQALLRASIQPHGLPLTKCQFEYGRTTHYGERIGCTRSATSPTVALSAPLAGLAPATTYHFRLLGGTAVGASITGDERFTTPQLPSVAVPQVRLRTQGAGPQAGAIGKLLALRAISGVTAGETIRVVCQTGCAPHVVNVTPIGSAASAAGWIRLRSPLPLLATTQIEVTVSASGKLSRYISYGFTAVKSGVAVTVLHTGCQSAGWHPLACRAPAARR